MACTNCASACKRCDEARPCQRCQKYGLTDSCVDGVRKARKVGVKRGPYKRKSKVQASEAAPYPGFPPTGEGPWVAPSDQPDGTPPGAASAIAPQYMPPEGYWSYPYYPPPHGYVPPQTVMQMGTVVHTGSQPTTPLIIQSIRDIPQCRCILRLPVHLALFLPHQARRRPLSKRKVIRRQLLMIHAPRQSVRRRKNVQAARRVCPSPVRNLNVEQIQPTRRPHLWWRRHPLLCQLILLMTTVVPWPITDPVVLVFPVNCTFALVALIRSHPTFEKTQLLLRLFQVLLQSLLDHLVGYFIVSCFAA
ncbi:hypothetical protein BGY98DRAFT_477209 [Russula aff. rugulosa BPL654]|nr:hypothetical protein BGY98DRAFT_477209 [Russula aff. rugulosa BPL654]